MNRPSRSRSRSSSTTADSTSSNNPTHNNNTRQSLDDGKPPVDAADDVIATTMERRGVGRRLTDGQRVEILRLFESGARVSEADVARRYGVSRSAIWRLRRSSAQILARYEEGDVESRNERRRGSLGGSTSRSVRSDSRNGTGSRGASSDAGGFSRVVDGGEQRGARDSVLSLAMVPLLAAAAAPGVELLSAGVGTGSGSEASTGTESRASVNDNNINNNSSNDDDGRLVVPHGVRSSVNRVMLDIMMDHDDNDDHDGGGGGSSEDGDGDGVSGSGDDTGEGGVTPHPSLPRESSSIQNRRTLTTKRSIDKSRDSGGRTLTTFESSPSGDQASRTSDEHVVTSTLGRDATTSSRHYNGSGHNDAVHASHGSHDAEIAAAATASSPVRIESAALPRLVPPASLSPSPSGSRWHQPPPPAAPEVVSVPTTSAVLPLSVAPLVYLSTKAISSVQAPGVLNWERVNGQGDRDVFAIASDGVAIVRDGTYHVTVDVVHSEPRQSYKRVFRVWVGEKVVGQCDFPVRTTQEVALSIWEQRVHVAAGALVRVEFLAGGFAFHESRLVLRLVPQ